MRGDQPCRNRCLVRSRDRATALGVCSFRERLVQLLQRHARSLAIRANHNPVRIEKVRNRSSLPQELRVRCNAERSLRRAIPNQYSSNPIVRPRRNRTLHHYDFVPVDIRGDVVTHHLQNGEVCFSRFARWSSHRDEHYRTLPYRFSQVRRKTESLARVLLQQLWQELLMNDAIAALQCTDFTFIIVDANDSMADLSHTSCCYQSDVPRPDDCNIHARLFVPSALFEFCPTRRLSLLPC